MDGLIFNDGWIAMDKDGEWYWHSEEPRITYGNDFWSCDGSDAYLSTYCFKNLPKDIDWKESKQKVGNFGNLGRLT